MENIKVQGRNSSLFMISFPLDVHLLLWHMKYRMLEIEGDEQYFELLINE